MARSRRTKVPAEEKTRLVLAVLANEMTCAEAARRCGVTTVTMTKWKHQFLAAGAERLEEVPSGAAGVRGTPEQRRLQMENSS
jgi:transposase-like protein